jgi:hypothetical protein
MKHSELYIRALNQATDAVVAFVLGMPFRSIEADEGGGDVTVEREKSKEWLWNFWGAICYGAPIAIGVQMRPNGVDKDIYAAELMHSTCELEVYLASEEAAKLNIPYEEIRNLTMHLVDQNWHTIECFAKALVACEKLTFNEFVAIAALTR